MAQALGNLRRTCRCGEVTEAMIGQEVTLMGWVAKCRNKGGIAFVDGSRFGAQPEVVVLRVDVHQLEVLLALNRCRVFHILKHHVLHAHFIVHLRRA